MDDETCRGGPGVRQAPAAHRLCLGGLLRFVGQSPCRGPGHPARVVRRAVAGHWPVREAGQQADKHGGRARTIRDLWPRSPYPEEKLGNRRTSTADDPVHLDEALAPPLAQEKVAQQDVPNTNTRIEAGSGPG